MPEIPDTWETGINSIMVRGQPRQNISGTPISLSISQLWWCTSAIPAVWKE
jgi:hypothetical protein